MEADRDARGRVTEVRLLIPSGLAYATVVTLGWDYDGADHPIRLYEDGLLLSEDTYQSNRLIEHWTANGNTKIWSPGQLMN